MLFRTFLFVSNFSRFQTEVSHLKEILRKNAFTIKLVDNRIKNFFNKRFLNAPVALTVEKKKFFIALPYLGNLSLAIRTRLQNSIVLTKIFLFLRSRHVLVNFSVLKVKRLLTYALMLFTSSCVVDAMLPIITKLADI